MNKMCPGGSVFITRPDQVPASRFIGYGGLYYYYFTDRRKLKRIRIACPKCGRRVMSSISLGHDEDYILHELPPHKTKHWWKHSEKKRGNKRRRTSV
ncbi:MAG: hypothetical protein ACYDH2_14815 [Anaerolineaceae bacterium]